MNTMVLCELAPVHNMNIPFTATHDLLEKYEMDVINIQDV